MSLLQLWLWATGTFLSCEAVSHLFGFQPQYIEALNASYWVAVGLILVGVSKEASQ